MSKVRPIQFVREVRQEMNKVTWPTRQETTMSVIMVCVLAILAALYFVVIDNVIRFIIQFIMSL